MILYLDTSSIVKLYVAETGSETVRGLVRDADVVATSMVAYPELRAALARRRRDRTLRATDFTRVKRAFEADWPAYLAIGATTAVCRDAGELAERYGLCGYDSVHLASYAEVARGVGVTGARFSSFDDRLNEAASALTRALARQRSRAPLRGSRT